MQVTGDKNVAAGGDLHIHASKSWFGEFLRQSVTPARRSHGRAVLMSIFAITDAALVGAAGLAPALEIYIAIPLMAGSATLTLLSIYLCTHRAP